MTTRRNLVVEPLPGGWCRCWIVVTYADGSTKVGPETWARTSKVLAAGGHAKAL